MTKTNSKHSKIFVFLIQKASYNKNNLAAAKRKLSCMKMETEKGIVISLWKLVVPMDKRVGGIALALFYFKKKELQNWTEFKAGQ